jgi:hypothetical protein
MILVGTTTVRFGLEPAVLREEIKDDAGPFNPLDALALKEGNLPLSSPLAFWLNLPRASNGPKTSRRIFVRLSAGLALVTSALRANRRGHRPRPGTRWQRRLRRIAAKHLQ